MKKLIILLAYFGKLPSYFSVWLKAAEFNATIDFCIISDCIATDTILPANVKVKEVSFEEFKQRVQEKFSFRVNIHDYGRVSQFRPAFAYIFDEIVEGYDNWGYVECDLIPGDIRAFLTDDLLDKYDKCFKLGHFQVFKNNPSMNNLFMTMTPKALNYQFAFQKYVLYFEEVIGMYNICIAEKVKLWDKRVFADIDYTHYYFEKSQFGYWDQKSEMCLFSYENGKLYEIKLNDHGDVVKEEILYVHLQKRAMEVTSKVFSRYIIIPNEFAEYREIDRTVYDSIVNVAVHKDKKYHITAVEKERRDRNKRRMRADWWLFYLKRINLKLRGCVGLSGKKGVL